MSIHSIASQIVTSSRLRGFNRRARAGIRRLTGRPKTLLAFLEPGEPYSEALGHALPALCDRYGLTLCVHTVGPPSAAAAPEPERLRAFARRDAAALCGEYGLPASASNTILADADPLPGERLRARLGHYASAALWFEGEWYPGLDRLHYLERRLGARTDACLFPPPAEPDATDGGDVDLFFSLRSPYSYIALMRIGALRDKWGASIRLRPVLPMVMRSLPVPPAKRLYIVRDCKREAERFGLPFGRIEDPLGNGVERGLACFYLAEEKGCALEFLHSFMAGVWAEGVNAAGDTGLRRLTDRAGLDWNDVRQALSDDSWRSKVEGNRSELFAAGLWGVPSFVVGARATFGQDRLWQVGRWLLSQN